MTQRESPEAQFEWRSNEALNPETRILCKHLICFVVSLLMTKMPNRSQWAWLLTCAHQHLISSPLNTSECLCREEFHKSELVNAFRNKKGMNNPKTLGLKIYSQAPLKPYPGLCLSLCYDKLIAFHLTIFTLSVAVAVVNKRLGMLNYKNEERINLRWTWTCF